MKKSKIMLQKKGPIVEVSFYLTDEELEQLARNLSRLIFENEPFSMGYHYDVDDQKRVVVFFQKDKTYRKSEIYGARFVGGAVLFFLICTGIIYLITLLLHGFY